MGAVGSVDSDNSENLSDALFCCRQNEAPVVMRRNVTSSDRLAPGHLQGYTVTAEHRRLIDGMSPPSISDTVTGGGQRAVRLPNHRFQHTLSATSSYLSPRHSGSTRDPVSGREHAALVGSAPRPCIPADDREVTLAAAADPWCVLSTLNASADSAGLASDNGGVSREGTVHDCQGHTIGSQLGSGPSGASLSATQQRQQSSGSMTSVPLQPLSDPWHDVQELSQNPPAWAVQQVLPQSISHPYMQQEHQWEESLNDGTLSRTSTIPKSSRSPPCTHPHQQTGTPPRSSHVPVLLTPTAIFYTTSSHTPPSSVQTDRQTDTHSNKPVHAQHTIAHTHTHTLSACRPQLISLLNSSLSPRGKNDLVGSPPEPSRLIDPPPPSLIDEGGGTCEVMGRRGGRLVPADSCLNDKSESRHVRWEDPRSGQHQQGVNVSCSPAFSATYPLCRLPSVPEM